MGVRRKVVAALTYPVILLALSSVLVSVLVYFVLPKFREFFASFDTELPWLTSSLIGFSEFVRDNFLLLGGGIAMVVVLTMAYVRTRSGRLWLDWAKIRVPLVGGVFHKYAISRFTRTLGTLVSGGIPLVPSLEIVARAVGNTVFEVALLDVVRKVREGSALWESLEESGLFSDMSIEMIKVGESTGALPDMLTQVSDFLDEEIDHQLGTIVTIVEPVMLILMAVVVATILLAIYYPMLQLYGGGARGGI